MKRLLTLLLMVLPVAAVTGCPMYPDECDSSHDCALGYACDRGLGECVPLADERPAPEKPDVPARCTEDGDCRAGQICDAFHRCVSELGGGAGQGSGGAGQDGGGAAGESSNAGQSPGGAAGESSSGGGAGESSSGGAGESPAGAAGAN
jgi:hypothetical protein